MAGGVWLHIGQSTSVVVSAALAIGYVMMLYIWSDSRNQERDSPNVIKQRFRSVALSCIGSMGVVWLCTSPDPRGPPFATWLGFTPLGFSTLIELTLPLALTMLLFLGPSTMLYLEHTKASFIASLQDCISSPELKLITLRNIVVGPLTEEFVYRSCICTLLLAGGWSVSATVLASPCIFGVAHLHHLINHVRIKKIPLVSAILIVAFQLFYTTVFGAYAGWIYLRTGSFLACAISHAFCNSMGFPDFGWFNRQDHALYAKRNVVGAAFIVGLVGFFMLLGPLTAPSIYGSWFYQLLEKSPIRSK